MEDPDNSLVTQVGKYVANASPAEPGVGMEETHKKTTKRRKNKIKMTENTAVINTNEEKTIEDVSILQLPGEMYQKLIAGPGGLTFDSETYVVSKQALQAILAELNNKNNDKVNEQLSQSNSTEVKNVIDHGDVLISLKLNEQLASEDLVRSQLEAVVKVPRPWKTLGSEDEILDGFVVNTRPLMKLNIETRVRDVGRPLSFAERSGDNEYGYASLGPSKRAPPTVPLARMEAAVQAVPKIKEAMAQVEPGLPVNAWTQYVYDLEGAQESVKVVGSELPNDYKFSGEDHLVRALKYNEIFNLYTDDYPLLAKTKKDKVIPTTVPFKLLDAVTDVSQVAGKVVGCISWHPMLEGVLAALYVPHTRALSKEHADCQTEPDVFSSNVILLWSLANTLRPFLIITSPREVVVIKWCPVDKNILVGACVNGQVAIWDLNKDWYVVEKAQILSESQARAHKVIYEVLQWPDCDFVTPKVSPTAMSNLNFSHRGTATDLQWLTPYHRLNTFGNYEAMELNEFSMQFMTSGIDGSVLIWDLNAVPPEATKIEKIMMREEEISQKKSKPRSRFKFYHRLMKPIYKFIPVISTRAPRLVFSALVVDYFAIKYELDSEDIHSKDTEKIYSNMYKPGWSIGGAPERAVWLGTEDGQVLKACWEGFEFEKDEEVTTESCEVLASCAAVHDGPVSGMFRSHGIPELIISVGGHVWAIWTADRPAAPILYRRSQSPVTCTSYSYIRPSMVYITTTDGTLEIWDFLHRSDRPLLQQSLSGEPLTAMSVLPYMTFNNCYLVAVGNYRNSLCFYIVPQHLMEDNEETIRSMRNFIKNELEIQSKYETWNDQYRKEIASRKSPAEITDQKKSPKRVDVAAKETADGKKASKPRRKSAVVTDKNISEKVGILLKKKSLNKEELLSKKEPIRRLQQMDEERKEKRKLKIQQQHEEYEKIATELLPEAPIEIAEKDIKSDNVLLNEIELIVKRAMEEWETTYKDIFNVPLYEADAFDRNKVLEEGRLRRTQLDLALFRNKAAEERLAARREDWLRNPPSPPPPIVPLYLPTTRAGVTSLAVCKPPPSETTHPLLDE